MCVGLQVEALLGFNVVDVACGSGDAQTLAITDDDSVWSWGDGDYGKLGRGGSDGCKVMGKNTQERVFVQILKSKETSQLMYQMEIAQCGELAKFQGLIFPQVLLQGANTDYEMPKQFDSL